MAVITYKGKVPSIQLVGYGHFSPGDSKTVDELTAQQMNNDLCRGEGWVVDFGDNNKKNSKKSADSESTKPAAEPRRAIRNDE